MEAVLRLRIKGWDKFQHYKDRRPPWIKLYRTLLDDVEWHELDPVAAKALISIWIIASEDNGYLPDFKALSFRLRVSENEAKSICSKLSNWLEQGASIVLAECLQHAIPETERETEKEKRKNPPTPRKREGEIDEEFEAWWQVYPRKDAKGQARKAYRTARKIADAATLIEKAALYAKGFDDPKSKFIRLPSTWLNGESWADSSLKKDPKKPWSPWGVARQEDLL